MSDFKITGNPNPEVGKEEFYSVNTLLPKIEPYYPNHIPSPTLNNFEYPVTWEVYLLERGEWRKAKGNEKTGNIVSFTFLQRSLDRKGIRILAKRGEQIARLDIKSHPAEIPKIQSVELLDKNGKKPTQPLAYGQTLKARVHCLHMDRRTIHATLWEDDADGGGHNKLNEKNKAKTLPGIVRNGIADIDFILTPDFKKIANARNANEGKTHEYYVTAEIFQQEKVSSNNLNVNNSDYQPEPQKQPAKKTPPAETKGKSKKDQKGIKPPAAGKKYDWVEEAFKIKPIFLPDPMDFTNSVMMVFVPDGEDKKKKGVCECESYELYYGKKVSCEFRKKVMKISKELWPNNYKEMANGLMAVMHRETNGTLASNQLEGYKSLIAKEEMTKDSFNKKNPTTGKQSSRAIGLIQFTQNSLVQMREFTNGSGFDKLHTVKLNYAKMKEVDQLEKVKKYMKAVKSLPKIPEDIYVAVFAPYYVDDSKDIVMYKKGTNDYVSNSSLDKNDNGIQIKELLGEFKTSLAEGAQYSKYKCKNSKVTDSNDVKCPDEKCIHYADVVDKPKINNQSNNVNKNRWHRVKRINNSHPNGYFHTGVDILTTLNTSLKSLLCGTVVEAYDTNGDLGKIVTIKSKDKDGNDIWIRYCHLNSISVKKEDSIRHGEKFGESGNSGNAKDIKEEYYHVHIEASTDGVFFGGTNRVDPEFYMKTKFDETTEGNPI